MADPAEQDNPVEGVDDGRPDWLPDNFKSPEDFAKSYQEAQRKITEESTARRNLEEAYMQQQAQIEELSAYQQQPQQNPNDVREQIYASYEQDPVQFMANLANASREQAKEELRQEFDQRYGSQVAPVQEAAQQQAAIAATYELTQRYPDFTEYQSEIGDLITQNPHLVPTDHLLRQDLLGRDLENLYKQAKFDKLSEQAEQNTLSASDQKRQAQTLSGGGGRPMASDDAKAHWDAVRNAAPKQYWEK